MRIRTLGARARALVAVALLLGALAACGGANSSGSSSCDEYAR
jgi:hypothetical protein